MVHKIIPKVLITPRHLTTQPSYSINSTPEYSFENSTRISMKRFHALIRSSPHTLPFINPLLTFLSLVCFTVFLRVEKLNEVFLNSFSLILLSSVDLSDCISKSRKVKKSLTKFSRQSLKIKVD